MAEYIEREALMAEHERYITEHPEVKLWTWSARLILNAPAADVRPVVRGKWIPAPEKGDCIYRCSQCDYEIDSYLCEAKNFCPNCGAIMEES